MKVLSFDPSFCGSSAAGASGDGAAGAVDDENAHMVEGPAAVVSAGERRAGKNIVGKYF